MTIYFTCDDLTSTENHVFADLRWFNFSPCYGDVQAYCQVCRYIVTSLLGVVTSTTEHTSDYTQPYSVMLGVVRGTTGTAFHPVFSYSLENILWQLFYGRQIERDRNSWKKEKRMICDTQYVPSLTCTARVSWSHETYFIQQSQQDSGLPKYF